MTRSQPYDSDDGQHQLCASACPSNFWPQPALDAPKQSSDPSSFGTQFKPPETTHVSSDSADNMPFCGSFDQVADLPAMVPGPTRGQFPNSMLDHEDKQKKKVGRPIAYKGDPTAPHLTDVERRRIKRRIANRESARRVRARRQETIEELQMKMDQIHAHNAQMVRHIAEVEGHSALLKDQLQQCEMQWNKAAADNARLHQQVSLLNSKAHEQAKQPCQNLSPHVDLCNFTSPGPTFSSADSYGTVPVTGISCALIDQLPTMALPLNEDLLTPTLPDEELSSFLL